MQSPRFIYDILSDIWDSKNEIKRILEDLGLDPTELDQDGPAKGVWYRAVKFADRHGKLVELVERAKLSAPQYTAEFEASLLQYRQSQMPSRSNSTKKEWPLKAYCLIDRKPQVDGFDKHLTTCQPLVMIWCGDEYDRLDILRERLNLYEPRVNKKWTLVKRSFNDLTDIDAELTSLCHSVSSGDLSDSECFRMLMTGKDYSNHLIAFDLDLEWSDHPAKVIKAISKWCENLGDMASDRRFVVRIAVNISKRFRQLWRFWLKPEALFIANCSQLKETLKGLQNVVILDPLGPIELKHLKFWRNTMFDEYHPREDDELGDTRLSMIVPERTQRFMDEVVKKLDPILAKSSSHAKRSAQD